MRGIDVGDCRAPSLPLVASEVEELRKVIAPYLERLTRIEPREITFGSRSREQ